jgi:Plasmid encoded RepA protein
MHLWFSGGQKKPASVTDDENVITLSKPFYDEINDHRIPVEREVLAALANAPGVLDFYVWLAWKTFTLRGRTAQIPLFGPSGLAAQLGNAPYVVERTFRLTVERWLRTIRALWPECPASPSEDGCSLEIRAGTKLCVTRRC